MNAIDLFMVQAREQGLTYAQAQVKETCELLRRQELKRQLVEKRKKEKAHKG